MKNDLQAITSRTRGHLPLLGNKFPYREKKECKGKIHDVYFSLKLETQIDFEIFDDFDLIFDRFSIPKMAITPLGHQFEFRYKQMPLRGQLNNKQWDWRRGFEIFSIQHLLYLPARGNLQ